MERTQLPVCRSSDARRGGPGTKSTCPVWQGDPEWVKVCYGDWGNPGVDAEGGPMSGMLLKDYAPKPSLVIAETKVTKARYAVIDVHAHNLAETPKKSKIGSAPWTTWASK